MPPSTAVTTPQAWLPSPLPLEDLSPARRGAPPGPGRDQYTTCSLRVLWGTAAGCQEAWTQNEGSDGAQTEGRGAASRISTSGDF